MKIPIYQPYLPKKSLKYAHDAIDSGWISSLGKYKNLCEEKLKEMFGYKYLLLVNSGTTAIHLVAKCLKYKYPHIERVIVPNNIYCAGWNAFLYDKEFKLFCSTIDEKTWNIDLKHVKLKPTDAILIVHNLGNIYNIPKLKRETNNEITIVEDNCEGLGGVHERTYSGTESLCSSISFFSNKNITSGEGGAFCTGDEDVYNYANLIHGQGQSSKRYVHNVLGNNFRMTNIQAALLLGQLEMFDEIMEMKRNIFYNYRKELSQIENIRIQFTDFNCLPSNWMMGLRIIGNKNYEEIEKYFNSNGIETRPMFYPMCYHEHLKNIDREDDPLSVILSEECFMVPSYPELKKSDQKYIIYKIKNYCKGVL